MKHSAWVVIAGIAWAPLATAGLFDEVKPHSAKYEYFQAGYVDQPDDFSGFDLDGSMPIASNVAVTGRLTFPSSDVNGITVDSRRVELGTRYYFAVPDMNSTDADIGLSLTNTDVSGGGVDESDSAVLVSGQFRRTFYRRLGSSNLAINEAYGGAQVPLDEIDSPAVRAGLLVGINPKVSANAELMVDDGTHLRLGVRMDLAKPNAPRRAALLKKKPKKTVSAAEPTTGALQKEPSDGGNRVTRFFNRLTRGSSTATDLDRVNATPEDNR
ncbi:MAG: hypothetical protein AAF499_11920 [Pseudomonadota bacterium]